MPKTVLITDATSMAGKLILQQCLKAKEYAYG